MLGDITIHGPTFVARIRENPEKPNQTNLT